MKHPPARRGSPIVARCRIGLGEGLVGRARRPADHHQKHIENEERDGDVVEEGCLFRSGQS